MRKLLIAVAIIGTGAAAAAGCGPAPSHTAATLPTASSAPSAATTSPTASSAPSTAVRVSHAVCARQVHRFERRGLSQLTTIAQAIGELSNGQTSSSLAGRVNAAISKLQAYEDTTPDCVPGAELKDTDAGITAYRECVDAFESGDRAKAISLEAQAVADWNKANAILDSYGLPAT